MAFLSCFRAICTDPNLVIAVAVILKWLGFLSAQQVLQNQLVELSVLG